LQGVLDLSDQVVDLRGGDGTFGTGDAHAFKELVAVELLAGAVALDIRGEARMGRS
jgi:tRNA/tmRNA/rRNA uracil-C5-methylase (TrmA/RlmC/RlmD family)